MTKKDIIEFLIGQKGNKHITVMEKIKYNTVICFIEQREKHLDLLKAILDILFKED